MSVREASATVARLEAQLSTARARLGGAETVAASALAVANISIQACALAIKAATLVQRIREECALLTRELGEAQRYLETAQRQEAVDAEMRAAPPLDEEEREGCHRLRKQLVNELTESFTCPVPSEDRPALVAAFEAGQKDRKDRWVRAAPAGRMAALIRERILAVLVPSAKARANAVAPAVTIVRTSHENDLHAPGDPFAGMPTIQLPPST